MIADLSALTLFHITAGGFGLAAGGTALLARKGAWLHRAAGSVFLVAMLLMAAAGAVLAVLRPAAPALNVIVAAVTLYMVTTSWATVARKEGAVGGFEVAALVAALAIAAGGLIVGLQAAGRPNGTIDGIPAFLFFFFAAASAFAALMDASVLVRGGAVGGQRIARHLWRMCFALFFAALAFFVGQGSKVLPDWARETRLNLVPLLVVLVLMLFWLFRVLLTGWYKRQSQVEATVPD
jgi:hypothetical protein